MKKKRNFNYLKKMEKVPNTLPETSIMALSPTSDVTELPYQGVVPFKMFYNNICNQCFELDQPSQNIVDQKFTGAVVRTMTTEVAVSVFEALQKAKIARTKVALDLMSKVANDAYWNRQLELAREFLTKQQKEEEIEKVQAEELEKSNFSASEKKQILKLLQQSIQDDIIEGKVID